jgi:hypothetical protein
MCGVGFIRKSHSGSLNKWSRDSLAVAIERVTEAGQKAYSDFAFNQLRSPSFLTKAILPISLAANFFSLSRG